MLAAIPITSSSLDLIKVALSLVAANQQNVPQRLQTFVEEVIADAVRLAAGDRNYHARHREAIDLALELRQDQTLAEDMGHIQSFKNIRPEAAAKMLASMECHPA